MTPLYTANQLIEYSKDLERQKEVLKLSTIFSPIEKIEVLQAFELLENKINTRLSRLQDIEDALNL